MTRAPWIIAALVAAPAAWAGRPLSVEDAAVVERNGCQLEAWIDRGDDVTKGWLVPACNFGLNTEWQAGFARTRADGDSRYAEAYVQAKTLLRDPTEAEPWGVGMVLGVTKRPLNELERDWRHPYALAVFTQKLCGAPVHFHANLGWTRDAEARRDLTLWGVAVEGEVADRVTLLAEAFGENSASPFLRVGARWVVVKDLAVDLSWVNRPGGTREERFVSLGVTWQWTSRD
jgi:hypothetical protein